MNWEQAFDRGRPGARARQLTASSEWCQQIHPRQARRRPPARRRLPVCAARSARCGSTRAQGLEGCSASGWLPCAAGDRGGAASTSVGCSLMVLTKRSQRASAGEPRVRHIWRARAHGLNARAAHEIRAHAGWTSLLGAGLSTTQDTRADLTHCARARRRPPIRFNPCLRLDRLARALALRRGRPCCPLQPPRRHPSYTSPDARHSPTTAQNPGAPRTASVPGSETSVRAAASQRHARAAVHQGQKRRATPQRTRTRTRADNKRAPRAEIRPPTIVCCVKQACPPAPCRSFSCMPCTRWPSRLTS